MRIVLTAIFCFGFMARADAAPAVWNRAHELRFVVEDPLNHPLYAWPRTLLSYPVRFEESVALERLALTRAGSGEAVPYQFSGVVRDAAGVRSATLNFFSDLPTGARREFVLALGAPGPASAGVVETQDGKSIVLDSGVLKVQIPATQTVSGDAPGPILQFSRGGPWIGHSKLTIAGDRIAAIQAVRLDAGPLFVAYKLTYTTGKRATYTAVVRCVAGLVQ